MNQTVSIAIGTALGVFAGSVAFANYVMYKAEPVITAAIMYFNSI